MRKKNQVQGNARQRKNNAFAVIDCETDPFFYTTDIKPFIWAFTGDGETVEYFSETADIVERIRNYEGHVYAHNGGKFDAHFLLPYLTKEDAGQQITVINGRLAKFKIGESTIYDSYCILPVPQRQMQKDEIKYWKMLKKNRAKYMDEILEYLAGDVLGLYPWIKAFREEHGVHLTLASAAFKTFYKMRDDIKPPKTDADYFNFFKSFYFGGRVTCFRDGIIDTPFKIYDVNSAYPRAMLEYHPFGSKFVERETIRDSEIPRSMIELTCYSDGALPFRHKLGVDYPIGRGKFKITGWEFQAALDCGLIRDIKIHSAYVFSEIDTFKDYIDYFYKLKSTAPKDSPQRLFAKLFLNSLYGKFAANPENYSEVMLTLNELTFKQQDALFNQDFEKTRIFGNIAIWEKPLSPEKGRYYNIATAASITGYQRAVLMRAISGVKNPLYCDTDSIFCEDGPNLILSDKLGDWTMEGAGTQIAIAGKKLYAAKLDVFNPDPKKGQYKYASKGAKLTPEEIFKIAAGGEITWTNRAPTFSTTSEPKIISRRIKNTVANGLKVMV